MGIATLRDGTKSAVFTWISEDDLVQVDITVDQLSECQKGTMSKRAARDFWKMLKEIGYTECP